MRGTWRDRLGGRLIRWGLHLISDRHAYWLWQQQTAYWTGARGQATIREKVGL